MRKNLLLLSGLTAMLFAACSKNFEGDINQPTLIGKQVSVVAYTPSENPTTSSRVSLTDNTESIELSWSNEDAFTVYRDGETQDFSKDTEGNTFTGVLPDADGSGTYYALYPTVDSHISGEVETFALTSQTGSLDPKKTLMHGTSTDGQTFTFSHLTSILKATFTGIPSGEKIKNITIDSNIKSSIRINFNGTVQDGAAETTSISVTPDTAIASTAEAYIYMRPMDEGTTLSFTVTTTDNQSSEHTYTGTLTSSKDIVAGKFYTASVAVVAPTPYITFSAATEHTLSYSGTDLQYSTDLDTWNAIDPATPIAFGNETKVYLRGVGNSDGTIDNGAQSFSFTGDAVDVICTGDIRTLVDYETYSTIGTGSNSAKFVSLFKNCVQLTTLPSLPLKKLAMEAYTSMFAGCTGLTTIPENLLPAPELSSSCYQRMFEGCTGLQSIPEKLLPSTVLEYHCYQAMFKGCTGLTSLPQGLLPDKSIEESAQHCYSEMFAGCTGLQSIPTNFLPATEFSNYCYEKIFKDCIGLTQLSQLSATNLKSNEGIYSNMFEGCTGLQAIPANLLPAKTGFGQRCYKEMFKGCTGLKEIPADLLPATYLSSAYCYQGMFLGCTGLTSLPATLLSSATTLNDYCYQAMFEGCTGLTEIPAGFLPANSLKSNCYLQMFKGCTGLQTIPANLLPADTLSGYCYQEMFKGCIGLETVPTNLLPATTLSGYCYYQMFQGCSALTTAPELRADKLSSYCYQSMFKECSKLNEVVMLATTKTEWCDWPDILSGWLTNAGTDQSVTSRTVYVKNDTMKSIVNSSLSGGWTAEVYNAGGTPQ